VEGEWPLSVQCEGSGLSMQRERGSGYSVCSVRGSDLNMQCERGSGHSVSSVRGGVASVCSVKGGVATQYAV